VREHHENYYYYYSDGRCAASPQQLGELHSGPKHRLFSTNILYYTVSSFFKKSDEIVESDEICCKIVL